MEGNNMENSDNSNAKINDTESVEGTATEVEETPAEIVSVNDNDSKDEAAAENKNNFLTQGVLTIRAIVGIYVLYLAYQIITSDGEKTPLIWAAVALFIVAGSALVIMSVKHFICGEYVGGKKDI